MMEPLPLNIRKSIGAPRAFTLIELLIVVAIIAILAAIAVPNFLEAQTRAKVSRSKSDMRSLATAVEAYAVDHNHHPIAEQWVRVYNTFNHRLRGVTTPVAFITTLPIDLFWNGVIQFPITPGEQPTYEYEDYTTAVVGESILTPPGGYNLFLNRSAFESYYGNRGGLTWAMHTAGPDRINDFQDPTLNKPILDGIAYLQGLRRLYDPTNGTVSSGDIIRTSAEQRN
jgi:type II secretion system protein G